MGHESATVVKDVNHARLIVDHDNRRRSQSQAADAPRAIKIERRVHFAGGEKAHADSAGNAGLHFSPFPNASTVNVDQFPGWNTKRQLDASRLVHMAADAVELGPQAAGVAGIIRVGRHADRAKPLDAPFQNVRHASRAFRRC